MKSMITKVLVVAAAAVGVPAFLLLHCACIMRLS
jgi:hypothetical protein